MKSILLTSTAIVAFAGAAVADGHTGIAFVGDAALGYNDDVEQGFYWDTNLDVTMTATLDNGITASASFGFELFDDEIGNNSVDSEDLVISLSSEMASLTFGDVDPVAEANWGGVDGASVPDFNDQDVHFTVVEFDAMLVGEVSVGGVTAMVSWGVFDEFDDTDDAGGDLEAADALQIYATGDFGMFSVEAAYQDELDELAEYSIFGISGTAAVAGAELTAAFITNTEDTTFAGVEEQSSFGLAVAYPVGPVTLGGYYSFNDDDDEGYGLSVDYADGPIAVNVFYDFTGGEDDLGDDTNEAGIEGSFDTGVGATLLAGYIVTDSQTPTLLDPEEGTYDNVNEQFYVAGVYDLGGGAEFLVSYAENEARGFGTNTGFDDEIGDPEYLAGTTIKMSFAF